MHWTWNKNPGERPSFLIIEFHYAILSIHILDKLLPFFWRAFQMGIFYACFSFLIWLKLENCWLWQIYYIVYIHRQGAYRAVVNPPSPRRTEYEKYATIHAFGADFTLPACPALFSTYWADFTTKSALCPPLGRGSGREGGGTFFSKRIKSFVFKI